MRLEGVKSQVAWWLKVKGTTRGEKEQMDHFD
jgi:hypothetical protein